MQNLNKKIIAFLFILGFLGLGGKAEAVGAPIVLQPYATNITSSSAQLNGTVNPNGSNTNAWFTTPASGNQQLFFQNIGGGNSNVSLQPYTLTGLQPNTTYSFNVVAQNSYGTSYSGTISFTTSGNNPPPPPQLPSVDLYANQTNLPYGGSTTIYWDAYNATSCNGSGGSNGWAGYKNPNGGSFNTGALYQTTTYNITCTNGAGSDSDSLTIYVTQAPPPPTPPSVNLSANPTNISYGSSSTLSWTSSNATSCYATGAWSGAKPTSGTWNTGALYSTKTYTLTCTGAGGSATDSVTVNVAPQVQNPTVNLSANSMNLPYNGSTTLTWYSNNATSCNATGGTSGWSGPKPLSGTFNTGNLTNTTTFTLTCSNSSGSASDSVTIYVGNQPVHDPVVNLSANPTYITMGGTTNLSWTSSYATSCVASGGTYGWSGTKPTSGNETSGPIYGTTTFTLTCSNSSGSASDSVTIYVQQTPNNPTVDLNASQTNISYGSATTLSWNSNNATSCVASGGTNNWPGSKNLSGSENTGALYNNTTFTLTCSSSSGSASDSVTIYVGNDNNDNGDKPEVSTDSASNISETSATLNGEVEDWNFDHNEDEGEVRFEYSDDRDDVEDGDGEHTRWEDMDDEDEFSERITGLRRDTTYYFRAIARNDSGTDYGSIKSFRTDDNGSVSTCTSCAPQAITTLATNIDNNSARLNGLGIVNGNSLTTGYFEWGRTASLGNTTPSNVIGNTGSNPFYASLFSLSSNTTYYYRAVVINQYGISRGDITSFRTNGGGSVAGSSTVVYRNTTVVSNDVSGTARPSLVMLDINRDDDTIYRGELEEYTVTYRNISKQNLRNIVLQISLPKELKYEDSSRGYLSEVNNTVVVNIGDLNIGEEGQVYVTVRVTSDAELGKIVVIAANLAYTKTDDTQEEVFAYTKNTIDEGRVDLRGGAIFGGSFLPNTLLGWILLLLILLLILLAAKRLTERNDNRGTAMSHGHGGHGTPNSHGNPPNNLPGAHSTHSPINEPPRYY